jgi:Luciferase-like monooxygenase
LKIGIGLPNPVPNTPGHIIVDWAKRAEAAGFSGLVTIDRIAYPSYDSLTTHAAAAGATERISLMTNILLAPIYTPVLLAKTAASIDQISSGRFTLGLAAGGRQDDYEVSGRDFRRRGRDFDDALEVMHKVWRGERLAEIPTRQVRRQLKINAFLSCSAAPPTRRLNASSRGAPAGLRAAGNLPRQARLPRGYGALGLRPVVVASPGCQPSPTSRSATTRRTSRAGTFSTTTALPVTSRLGLLTRPSGPCPTCEKWPRCSRMPASPKCTSIRRLPAWTRSTAWPTRCSSRAT